MHSIIDDKQKRYENATNLNHAFGIQLEKIVSLGSQDTDLSRRSTIPRDPMKQTQYEMTHDKSQEMIFEEVSDMRTVNL
jgi:hypothetical protein